jgi:hypothetical protein
LVLAVPISCQTTKSETDSSDTDNSDTDNCEVIDVVAGTNTNWNSATGDWDSGYGKTECTGDKIVFGLGVEHSTNRVKKILCCDAVPSPARVFTNAHYGGTSDSEETETLDSDSDVGDVLYAAPSQWVPGTWLSRARVGGASEISDLSAYGSPIANWDPGYWKGTCLVGAALRGISVPTDAVAEHEVLCEEKDFDGTQVAVLSSGGDSRRTSRSVRGNTDWASGYWKLECGQNEVVTGLSMATTSPYAVHKVRCSPSGATANNGASANLAVGTFTTSQLSALGIDDNTISSIRVAPGYQVRIYQNDSFDGEDGVVVRSQPDLVNFFDNRADGANWNDTISSVKVEKVAGKVGVRALPRNAGEQASWGCTGCGNWDDNTGLYPIVAANTFAVMDYRGDFTTKRQFEEYYLPFEAYESTDPVNHRLINWIKGNEDAGRSVEHLVVARETRLIRGNCDSPNLCGPIAGDSRILWEQDVTNLRQLFVNAKNAGLTKRSNYKLIALVLYNNVCYTDSRARSIILSMDGVCPEIHHFEEMNDGRANPVYDPGWRAALAEGAAWVLNNKKDYVFYYGPFQMPDCGAQYWHDDMYREWINLLSGSSFPWRHGQMHLYLNAFPHACGMERPVGPEENPESIQGFMKWTLEKLGG